VKNQILVGEANLVFLLLFSCCLMNEAGHVSFFYLCLVMKPFENLVMRFLLHGFMCAWSFHSFFWLCAWVSFNVIRYLKKSVLRLLHCGAVFFLLGSILMHANHMFLFLANYKRVYFKSLKTFRVGVVSYLFSLQQGFLSFVMHGLTG